MKSLKLLFIITFACSWFGTRVSLALEDDIYAVQFTEDGQHLVTGGSGGYVLGDEGEFTGGIKLWELGTGKLVKTMGQQADIETIFGTEYGRVGKRRWGINTFKDLVITGSYPEGRIVLLPSSLSRLDDESRMHLPGFAGGYLDFDATAPARIGLDDSVQASNHCGDTPASYEYIGPVVASENGRYAAIVVNTCKAGSKDKEWPEYDSSIYVTDLSDMRVVRTVANADSGMYAIGISDDGARVAFVGRDRFAVVNADNSMQVIEEYSESFFQVPRQFSTLYFNKAGNKLVSLDYVYDLNSGKETAFGWDDDSAAHKGRTASVKVAPDLNYFVLVKPKRSFIKFGEDGLPQSYGKADKVIVLDTRTGEERELAITDSRSEGKRCVTDISPNSKHVAVACAGGLLKVFEAASGELVWEQRNYGYRNQDLSEELMHVDAAPTYAPLLLALSDTAALMP